MVIKIRETLVIVAVCFFKPLTGVLTFTCKIFKGYNIKCTISSEKNRYLYTQNLLLGEKKMDMVDSLH